MRSAGEASIIRSGPSQATGRRSLVLESLESNSRRRGAVVWLSQTDTASTGCGLARNGVGHGPSMLTTKLCLPMIAYGFGDPSCLGAKANGAASSSGAA